MAACLLGNFFSEFALQDGGVKLIFPRQWHLGANTSSSTSYVKLFVDCFCRVDLSDCWFDRIGCWWRRTADVVTIPCWSFWLLLWTGSFPIRHSSFWYDFSMLSWSVPVLFVCIKFDGCKAKAKAYNNCRAPQAAYRYFRGTGHVTGQASVGHRP